MFSLLLLKFKAMLRGWLMIDSPPMLGGELRKPATIKDGAAQLVERARQGDQNAMALIAEVGENAKKKVPRAMKAYDALLRYIKLNPVAKNWGFGEDAANKAELDSIANAIQGSLIAGEEYATTVLGELPELAARNLNKAVVTLANGPSLLPEDGTRFQEVRSSLSPEDENAFMAGYKHGINELASIPPKLVGAFLLGHVVGTARRIQAIRLPDVPISVLSSRVGAELGE
jgi:hypothetical protein